MVRITQQFCNLEPLKHLLEVHRDASALLVSETDIVLGFDIALLGGKVLPSN
jgi:hypothetical protein